MSFYSIYACTTPTPVLLPRLGRRPNVIGIFVVVVTWLDHSLSGLSDLSMIVEITQSIYVLPTPSSTWTPVFQIVLRVWTFVDILHVSFDRNLERPVSTSPYPSTKRETRDSKVSNERRNKGRVPVNLIFDVYEKSTLKRILRVFTHTTEF